MAILKRDKYGYLVVSGKIELEITAEVSGEEGDIIEDSLAKEMLEAVLDELASSNTGSEMLANAKIQLL